MHSGEHGKRWIDCGDALEHTCICGCRKLETSVLLWNRETQKSSFRKLDDHFLGDSFVFVELWGIDNAGLLHPVDLCNQSPNSLSFFRISFLQPRRKRKEKLVVDDACKNAACER